MFTDLMQHWFADSLWCCCFYCCGEVAATLRMHWMKMMFVLFFNTQNWTKKKKKQRIALVHCVWVILIVLPYLSGMLQKENCMSWRTVWDWLKYYNMAHSSKTQMNPFNDTKMKIKPKKEKRKKNWIFKLTNGRLPHEFLLSVACCFFRVNILFYCSYCAHPLKCSRRTNKMDFLLTLVTLSISIKRFLSRRSLCLLFYHDMTEIVQYYDINGIHRAKCVAPQYDESQI